MIEIFQSYFRIAVVKCKYPDVNLSGCFLEKGVSILCTDNSKIKICNTHISTGSLIAAKHGGNLFIDESFVGRNSVIVACGDIQIGCNCQIAEMVVIRDHNHQFSDASVPIANQGLEITPIRIGSNVWIGAKATVLAGSIIGDHSVIGAHGLVNSQLEGGAVYVGLPVKKVKNINAK